MDGRGGCCIARYTGSTYQSSKVDRIMLRFRPIAPKPATASCVSGGSSPENSEVPVKSGRGKRKYVRDTKSKGNGRRCNVSKKRKASPDETVTSLSGGDTVVTLPLLPETPDRKETLERSQSEKSSERTPIWLSFDGSKSGGESQDLAGAEPAAVNPVKSDRAAVVVPQAVRVVGSCVTVENVTDTWVDGDGLGCSDEERVMSLKRDTCPGFVSDAQNRICWANSACREMVGQAEGGEMMMWLVLRDRVAAPPATCRAFTCRVKVTCGKDRSTMTLPCDVWRMDGGGFAWRLDVKAALCLGR
ncbi:hypothetical protein RJ639_026929 [Escallonia herrerae]|uniref:DUF7950 domain-containing protein n=1 Tax=Escallonia herrerae TaxID=1293975 RepID=A0AA88X638_9ASTE|nr:hypothetical protein RJ639_026929 [Escallonia herrerae]